MKSLILCALALAVAVAVPVAEAASYTRGYFRSNGTYVQPYMRSNPDGYRYNNWSTKGNYNPYTGKKGYKSWLD